MIYRAFLIFFIFSMSFGAVAQIDNLDNLMTRKYISCEDVRYNCSFLIPDYYQKGKLDSVNLLLDYLEKRCGGIEEIRITRLLFSIQNGTFNEKQINATTFYELMSYNRLKMNTSQFERYGMGFYDWGSSDYLDAFYRNFTLKLANSLKDKQLTPTEQFFVNFYADSSAVKIGKLLNSNDYAGTLIQQRYKSYKDSVKRIPAGHLGFYTGCYIPLGNNQILGNKLLLGFRFGSKFYKNYLNFCLNAKIGKAKDEYFVMHENQLTKTDVASGAYIGAEYERVLFASKKTAFLCALGFGGENTTAIQADTDADIKSKILWTTNFNGGLGIKHYYGFDRYIGLSASYNYLNLNNKGGTDLSGNALSIRLAYGFSSNWQSDNLYKYLD